MTTSSCVPHGPELDDCCSNAFALTDLCGLKWRKYIHAGGKITDPSRPGDPVLSSYSLALAQDILCAWRSTPRTPKKTKESLSDVNVAKEFWVFWYGDEPNLVGIVSSQLIESSNGCWEDGLTHEPRSLLYKALHNLLERCLLSKKVVRLGRWFVKQNEKSDTLGCNSEYLSFSFSFFVHGESTVCTAVEIQQGPKVRSLVLDDLVLASTRPEGLQVLLSPFGQSGFITGESQHVDDDKTTRLLEEWSKFYPLDISSNWMAGDSQGPDQEVPAMVMVISSEVNMMYPSAYVMVACSDDEEVFAPSTDAMQCAILPSPVSLTPPSSPSDPINTDASKTSTSDKKSVSVITPSSCVSSQSLLPKHLTNPVNKKELTQALVQEVWREITAPKPPPSKLASSKLVPSFIKPESYTAPSPGGEVSLIGQPLWEFEEPFKRNNCGCTSSSNISRPKPATQVRTSFGISRPIPSPNHPLPSPQQQQQQQQQQQPQPQQQQTTQTTMKLKKEKKKPIIPFHHRPLLQQDIPEAVKCYFSMATKGLPTVNSLTSISHKRHSDCAGTYLNKYILPAQPTSNKQTNSIGTSDTNFHCNIISKNDKCGQLVSDKHELNAKPESSASSASPSSQAFSKYTCKSSATKTHKKTYMLPRERAFVIPSLPGNSLDCRPTPSLPSPSTSSSIQTVISSPSQPLWESGVKRLSLDVEIESVPSPAKKTKREPSVKSVGPGRPRSDSLSSTGRRGRRSSSLQSPTVPITPSAFPVKTEDPDVEMTMPIPPMKSPTQARGSRQRRRSSTSSAASPSVPSPMNVEQQKPSRPRQRRQSTRKQQQQEEKEKQLKEQEEEETRASFSSFDTSMQKILPSPPTPRPIPISNLMTDKDLMVTANDLDQLFDLDDDDDTFNSTIISDNNCNNHIGHGSINKSMDTYNPSQTTVTTGVVASQDLARMYPTPPSLEPVAHSPPCSGSDYISPGSVKTMACSMAMSPETHLIGLTVGIDAEHKHLFSPKELGPVFEIPDTEDFPMTSSFGPVTGLPSERRPLPKSLEKLVNQSKWQMSQGTDSSNSTSQNDKRNSNNIEVMQTESTLIVPSPAIGGCHGDIASVSSDTRQYTTLSPLSPASSISSFTTSAQLSKHIPGRITKIPSKLLATSLPQTSALSKTLTLSDSQLNYFSDKNFDNVNLCVCTVQILSKPDPKGLKHRTLSDKRLDSNRCTCGFLSLEQHKFDKGQGLFPEDEFWISQASKAKAVTVSGQPSIEVKRDESMPQQDPLFGSLVEIVVDQCSSPFSCSTMKDQMVHVVKQTGNSAASDNEITNKGHDSKNTANVPSTVAVAALHGLRQILQEALQKSTSRKTWEQPNGTMVQGPLSWKQLHHIAVKGSEESPPAEPIPAMLVGNGGDWMSLSPFSFQFWEKLLLEPFSTKRDIAYVVVAPENDPVLTSTKLFFKELSSLYETCRLGQHVPIAKLRDGILRVGQKSLKLSKENVDDWFSQQSTTSEGARLKLYALVCKHHLAPLLSTLKVDRQLLERDKSDEKINLKTDNGFPYSGSDGSRAGTIGTPTSDSASTPTGDDEETISDEPPTIVVYLVDPFTGSNGSANSISYVGLLRCFAEMTQGLTDNVKSNVVLQVVPLSQILQVDNLTKCRESSMSFIMQLKCLAFSVFSRCRKTIQLNINAKSLTGFGPAAGQEASVKNKEVDTICLKLYSCPFVLDTPIIPVIETNENGIDKVIPASRSTLVLHCGYCLSRDQRWLLTVCTDGTGEVIETNAISVGPPLRTDGRPRKTPTRTKALRKIWEFCVGVISSSLSSWRLVICKMGRMGQGEIRDWKEILSKTSYETREPFGREACNACFSLRSDLRPTIIGASLIALEPEPALRMYMAKGLTKATTSLDVNHQTPVTSITKPDVSRTYITVFTSIYHYKGTSKPMDNKTIMTPETTTETVITDTDILLAGADDDESDADPLRHLFPLLNTSPTPLSPTAVLLGSPLTSPLDENHLHSSSPHTRVSNLTSSPAVSAHSPFQPIGRASPFQPVAAASPSKSVTSQPGLGKVDDDCPILQPLAQGYVISTVHTGKLPSSFWANYPQAEKLDPVILRASMFIHNPDIIELTNGFTVSTHPLNSHANGDVLKYILQQFDALSWLNVDPVTRDRRSCLPVHLCMLSQLHDAFIHLLEKPEC